MRVIADRRVETQKQQGSTADEDSACLWNPVVKRPCGMYADIAHCAEAAEDQVLEAASDVADREPKMMIDEGDDVFVVWPISVSLWAIALDSRWRLSTVPS